VDVFKRCEGVHGVGDHTKDWEYGFQKDSLQGSVLELAGRSILLNERLDFE
jgi:hypothetical protein